MAQWWVSTKIRMPPRRCLPSWLGWQLHANGDGDLTGAGLAVALLASLVRALPGGPARVLPWHAVVPGKDLAGVLWFPSARILPGPSNPHLILNIPCLHKDLHATIEVPPEPWPNVANGVGDVGSRAARSVGVLTGRPGKGLAGLVDFLG